MNDKNCHNCKHILAYENGDISCARDMMNLGGYYDWEYYDESSDAACPKWEKNE